MEVGGKSPIFISKVAIEEYIVGLLFELELIVFFSRYIFRVEKYHFNKSFTM